MFVPVSINLGAGDQSRSLYNRSFELTARQLDAFARNAGNMTVPLTRIGEDLHTQMEAAFASQGATGASGRWKALSPAYAAFKEKHKPGLPTLVGLRPTIKRTRSSPRTPAQEYVTSGRMMKQLLVPLTDHATWHVTPRRLLYAPLSNIAGYHQDGTPRMPARPPVDPTVTFLHSIDRQFVTWVADLIDAAGL